MHEIARRDYITFRLTAAQASVLRLEAERQGITLSELCRRRVADQQPPERQTRRAA